MTIQKYTASFGTVRPILKGTYNPTLDYKHLNIVTTADASYICANRAGAPSGTSLLDGEYWQLIARNGRDGAVTFATTKEYESESASEAVSPALLKPLIDEIKVRHESFEKYGKAYDSARLDGKNLAEVKTYVVEGVDAAKLGGSTLSQVLAATAEGLLSANGYVKLANGLIIQWGSGTSSFNGATVTLPIAFPNACLWSMHSPTHVPVWQYGGTYATALYTYDVSINAARSAVTIKNTYNASAAATVKYLLIGY